MNNKKNDVLTLPSTQQVMSLNEGPRITQTADDKRAGWFNLSFVLLALGFILIGILNFNVKLFLMGDDANYILDGYNFIYKHTYPGQSSLYGMVMGVIQLVTGTDVVLLKCCSFLFAFIGFVTLYRIGYKRVEPRILYPVLIFSVINSNLQYYSSSNLSEAFYMMLQYLYTGFVFLFIDRLSKGGKGMSKYWLGLGFMGLLMSLGKNVAVVAPLSIVVYFLCYRQWRFALKAIGVFLLFKVPYEIMLRLVYGSNTGAGQLDQVLAKNLYHHEAGRETLAGFAARFLDNAQIYLSQVTLKELGIITNGWIGAIATIAITALLIFATNRARKKNKYIFFIALYTGIMSVTTFLALQADVAQDRIIIILVPYLLLLLLFALIYFPEQVNKKRASVNRVLYYVVLAGICWSNLGTASMHINNNLPVLRENISGDPYYGYTPDWVNYLEMGKWVSKHIPADKVVAARKANPLSVYCNGRDFYGIYAFPTNLSADQLLDKLKKDKVSYLIVASLRGNPLKADPANLITTIHKYGAKIVERYPKAMTVVHRVGKEEPCFLVKINYPERKGK